MVIGWDQISGDGAILYYGTEDNGRDVAAYPLSQSPDKVIISKGMNNHFVRLEGLRPNTIYYFVVKDSEGSGPRLSFKTAPTGEDAQYSIIAGGDSRNNRKIRLEANKMVSKIRPDFVMFSGDFTGGDTGPQWEQWLDDWQYTISYDGHLTPIIVARGNHEASNESLKKLFDVPYDELYYELNFGILSVFTLNTMIATGGAQKEWLQRSLKNCDSKWRMAQYHLSIKPHTQGKKDQNKLLVNWATLFYKHGVDLALESDAHVVKWTWPIKPSAKGEGGFVRDDKYGTIYVGEGGWGAPLRANNDDKKWTRNSGSFNQFKLIYVSSETIEIRTIKINSADAIKPNQLVGQHKIPQGIEIWKPSNGFVLTITPKDRTNQPHSTDITANADENVSNTGAGAPREQLIPNESTGVININYELKERGNVAIVLVNSKLREITRASLRMQQPGKYSQNLDISQISSGNYMLVIKQNGKLVKRFRVKK